MARVSHLKVARESATPQPAPKASVRVLIMGMLGLHARVALGFAEVASGFDASVHVRHADRLADGKSIFELLTLCATKGAELEITAEGSDATSAVDALRVLFERPTAEEL